ncbi:hypothetical protein DFP73DRAFT_550851 [Morchella snyderi]|nr:hypothetical protein DFP73DRAFT_550851 [Morchella snyderi]
MKFESIILSVLAAATTVVQAMPVPAHSIDANASNKQCEDIFKTDQKESFPAECTEIWNRAVDMCGLEPAPQPGTAIPAAEHRPCLEAALKQLGASEVLSATQPTKRESDQDRERREREFRERRDRAERERRERDDRERREREDRERREREDRERREREQNNRDKDGKPTNVCTHDDWKNNRQCAQP